MSYGAQAARYLSGLIDVLKGLDMDEVTTFVRLLDDARENGRQVFVCGNGGSALTASHLVCDLNKGASYGRDKRFRAICLSDNAATLMAYANDVSYESVFVEPLRNFMRPGDLVIGISGSGNSPNVRRAIEWANANGGKTVGLSGYSGGGLKRAAQHSVHVKVDDMQKAEDVHLVLGHVAMQILCAARDECG